MRSLSCRGLAPHGSHPRPPARLPKCRARVCVGGGGVQWLGARAGCAPCLMACAPCLMACARPRRNAIRNSYGYISDANPFFSAVLSKPYLNNVMISPHYYGPAVSYQYAKCAAGAPPASLLLQPPAWRVGHNERPRFGCTATCLTLVNISIKAGALPVRQRGAPGSSSPPVRASRCAAGPAATRGRRSGTARTCRSAT